MWFGTNMFRLAFRDSSVFGGILRERSGDHGIRKDGYHFTEGM